MPEAIYRSKSLLGLKISEGESITIIARSMAARHGTGAVARSSNFNPQTQGRERIIGNNVGV